MIRLLVIFARSVSAFNCRLGKAVGWLVWAVMGLFIFEAVSRYVFNAPHAWSLEITAYVFMTYFFLGGGYVLFTEEHVRMDVIYSRWSARRRAIFNSATFFLAAIYLGALIWRGFLYARIAVIIGETTPSAAATLVGPVKVIMVIGAVMLFLQAIAFLIQDLSVATRGKALE